MILITISTLLISFSNYRAYGHPEMNVIEYCWKPYPNWRNFRDQLASCSVGYAGKMTNNIGNGVIHYKVTDPSDDAMKPKLGTLRYAMTHVKGKFCIIFKRDMTIKLQKSLLVKSFSTIYGRGVHIHSSGGACLLLQRATNVILHSLRIHDCQPQPAGPALDTEGQVVQLGPIDGDAIRMVTSSKIWIDQNTLYDCPDGLINVTHGSTNIIISNNWFRSQDKVMLLGHDDGFLRDKEMKVTVAFNHFGPKCHQRMPRVRFGCAHVVNNMYLGWWKNNDASTTWNLLSVEDVLENGASLIQSR